MLTIRVYYQPFHFNAGIFHMDDVVLVPNSETHIVNFTVQQLKELGYEFEDGCDYEEYSQAIFELLNIRHDEIDVHKNTYRQAGHTSMSIGDFIIYQPTTVLENYVCHVCSPSGWKVVDDILRFENRHERVVNAVKNLPIDVIDAIAKLYNEDPLAFKKEFEHFTDNKCENHCPDCGAEADDKSWQEKQISDNSIFQTGKCSKCGHFFTEIYEYVRTEADEVTNKEIDEDKNE